jgi:hypothetical protein
MGFSVRPNENSVEVTGHDAVVDMSSFPVLRNVSLRLRGGDESLWRGFEEHLTSQLHEMESEPSPMAVSLLLVATAMIVAPLVFMIHQAPEIVRILTDLLP